MISMSEAVASKKIPYEVVETQVERMYAEGLSDNETLHQFLVKIETFIESCGWDIDEYDSRFQFGELN